MNIINKLFGTHSERELKLIAPTIDKIEALRPTMQALTDEELKDKTKEYKQRPVSYTHLDVYKRQVQEYGKIKALGATRKQMKQLIFREGILLAVLSIPLGLLFGFLIAKVSFNWLVEQGNLVSSGIKNHQVPLFSLTIMLICIFVSFLTRCV